MTAIQVHLLDQASSARWDAYVERASAATFFHLAGWRDVLTRAFGHRCFFLYAESNGEIVGVLPLAQVNSILFGNNLSSLPFCVYGGIVADTEAAEAALRQRGCELATELRVDALELRNINSDGSQWPSKDLYVTFKKPILEDDDANLKAIPNRQRAMIRKGMKCDLVSERDDGVDRLYRVYSESVRNLGTPVFSKKYLEVLLEVFGERSSVLMIRREEEDLAGVLSFYFRDEVLPYYGGSVRRARDFKGVNDFMYWELLRRSREQGIKVFDFGRSKKGTGAYKFKKNWGFEPTQLDYEYYLVKADNMPEVNPSNPKYKLLIDVWSRLPLPVANVLGPPLAKSLG